MRAPVSAPIPEAKRSEYAGGNLAEGTLTPLAKGELEKLAVTWDEFFQQSRQNAAAELAEIKPVYVRNRRKVIEYAELRSERGLLASAVLAPKFLEQFAETLGPTVLLVVPNRFLAFVFPRLASKYEEHAGVVLEAYRATAFPVSLEVFEVSPAGLKAVGFYPDPARD